MHGRRRLICHMAPAYWCVTTSAMPRRSQSECTPATKGLLLAFMAYLAAIYSGCTIVCYLNGIWGWHILHSVPWALEKEMDTMLRTADKLMPITLRRKKWLPYTPAFILGVQGQLNLDDPSQHSSACLPNHMFLCIGQAGWVHGANPQKLQSQHPCHHPKSLLWPGLQ